MRAVVMPGNEKELSDMAKNLGYSSLLLLYEKKESFCNAKLSLPYENSLLLSKTAQKEYSFNVVLKGADRPSIERSKFLGVVDSEIFSESYRKSGLEQVKCALLGKKGISVLFSFSTLLHAQDRGLIMGKMSQNIRLCRKYRVPMRIALMAKSPLELRAPKDVQSLFILLGMHPKEAVL